MNDSKVTDYLLEKNIVENQSIILHTSHNEIDYSKELKEPLLEEETVGELKHRHADYQFEYRKLFVYLLTLNAAIGSFNIGWNVGVFDTVQINLEGIFGWPPQVRDYYLSAMSSVLFIGGMIGAAISTYTVNYFGRRKTYIFVALLSLIGISFTIVLNEYCIITGRFITGICLGHYTYSGSIYINEFVPYEIIGTCGALKESMYCLGILGSYLMGLGLPPVEDTQNNWWRIMVIFPGLLACINVTMLLLFFKHDTPKYLYITMKDEQGAHDSLKSIYTREECIQEMLLDLKRLSLVQESHLTIWDMIGEKYRLRLFIGCMLLVAQQACGIDALLMFSDTIFLNDSGVTDRRMATIYTNLIGLSQLLSAIVAIFVIEIFGRRMLILFGEFFISLILLCLSICYYYSFLQPVVYLFFAYSFVNGMSLSPMTFIYAADILPDRGVNLALLLNNFSSFVETQLFLIMKNSFLHLYGTLLIYSFLTMTAFILSFFLIQETKGLSANQIDKLFKKKHD